MIKNTKKTEIQVILYEQLPLSGDSKIKVTLLEPKDIDKQKDIKLNSKNNIRWKLTIAAGSKVDVPLSYDIEWPKDKEVSIQEDI